MQHLFLWGNLLNFMSHLTEVAFLQKHSHNQASWWAKHTPIFLCSFWTCQKQNCYPVIQCANFLYLTWMYPYLKNISPCQSVLVYECTEPTSRFSETNINGNRFLLTVMVNKKLQCLRTTWITDPDIKRLLVTNGAHCKEQKIKPNQEKCEYHSITIQEWASTLGGHMGIRNGGRRGL